MAPPNTGAVGVNRRVSYDTCVTEGVLGVAPHIEFEQFS